MVFKKKEKIKRISLILKDRKVLSYNEFISNWSKNFTSFFPIFVGLLATIFITLFIKDMSIPAGEIFSSILTMAFSLIVLSSLWVSIIVAGILYVLMILGLGSLVYLIQKLIDKIISKWGVIPIIIVILVLFLIGVPLSLTSRTLTWLWMFGLLLEALGIIIGIHIISGYIEIIDNIKNNTNLPIK